MPNLRDLRKRRTSVGNTRKITRTMELVASAKLKKAQDAAAASRPYADALRAVAAKLAASLGPNADHPLMTRRRAKQALILVATSDRGLCGSFNANLVHLALRRGAELTKAGTQVSFIALGKKAASTLTFAGHAPVSTHQGLVGATRFAPVQKLANELMARFVAGGFDLAEVVYARFISVSRQTPDKFVLLPAGGDAAAEPGPRPDFIFNPDAASLLAVLIPQTVRTALFSALLQTSAGEHAARRIAMKNATDAANDMLRSLTIRYNRGRQGKITQEIAEIVGAVEAMA
jgi:F-type H+-transporting ATPase subunit gamma